MKLEKRKENRNRIVFLLLGIFILIILVFMYINFTRPVVIKKYDVRYEVSNKIGFDLNSTALNFGRTVPGSTVTKEINVANQYPFSVKLEVLASEDISESVHVNDEIILRPGEQVSFPIYLTIPLNSSFGNYSGIVVINFWKFRG